MKRGKDNGFSDKGGGPPGYVPLTLHQLGIGLTYYDEQRPSPPRGRQDNRRHDGNGRFDGNVASPQNAGPQGGQGNADESFDGAEPGPDDGMTQEAALDQMQQNRSAGHQGGNNRRNHHGGGGQGGSRRSRHNGGGHNNRRGGGGSHNGPMRGGIVQVGRRSRDEETLDGATERGNARAERAARADRGGSDANGNSSRAEAHSDNGSNGGWHGGESEE